MEKVNVFKNLAGETYCEIFFDKESNGVIDRWSGNFGSQDNFKQAIKAVLEAIGEYGATAWVADISQMKGSFDSSGRWLQESIVPMAKSLGITRQAVVLPSNIFSKLSAKDNVAVLEGYEIKEFGDICKAIEWASRPMPKTLG